MYVGVDGCPDGWIAVRYDDDGYVGASPYPDVEALWDDHADRVDTVLIDVPIGLREESATKRPCDDAARSVLGSPRQRSVFAVPIRDAVHEETYADGKAVQESRTDGSIGVQSWHISDRIAELDTFLRETAPEAVGTVREAHPEVCFWALNDGSATRYSKTARAAAGFWERVAILEPVDPAITAAVRDASTDLDVEVGNDDVIDAFALALTASPLTGEPETLPERWPADDEGDPTGLPMEMVYARP